jgi:hypothetical protein
VFPEMKKNGEVEIADDLNTVPTFNRLPIKVQMKREV